MSGAFQVDTFERYLKIVRDELPAVRKYFRGQSRPTSSGYELLPSFGRYAHLRLKTTLPLWILAEFSVAVGIHYPSPGLTG